MKQDELLLSPLSRPVLERGDRFGIESGFGCNIKVSLGSEPRVHRIHRPGLAVSAADDPSVSQSVFTITKEAPTRTFSWLKAPNSDWCFHI